MVSKHGDPTSPVVQVMRLGTARFVSTTCDWISNDGDQIRCPPPTLHQHYGSDEKIEYNLYDKAMGAPRLSPRDKQSKSGPMAPLGTINRPAQLIQRDHNLVAASVCSEELIQLCSLAGRKKHTASSGSGGESHTASSGAKPLV